jgi:hypothetical protein
VLKLISAGKATSTFCRDARSIALAGQKRSLGSARIGIDARVVTRPQIFFARSPADVTVQREIRDQVLELRVLLAHLPMDVGHR